MIAEFSPCRLYRYRLEREVSAQGPVIAYFGVNPSTADEVLDDHTVRKWRGFAQRLGASRFIVGNAFAYRSKDVGDLARLADPVGPDNDAHLRRIAADADVVIACWGARAKLPRELHHRLDAVMQLLQTCGKPVMCFGQTDGGDPLHPLTLAYATPLRPWAARPTHPLPRWP